MAPLKLVNNTGLESEKNLCFVNAELQLLYSIPDVKDFFATKKHRGNCQDRLQLCDELSRIFRTDGQFQTTAAELRRLTGKLYRREDICNGEQQDIEEFHTLLLRGIEQELARVEGVQSRFTNKFKGREENKKSFLYTADGCCPQGHMPRTEVENFQVIKIDVPESSRIISLNNMVSNHFAEDTTTFFMKCSDCCKHTTRCPQTGKCKLKEDTSKRCLISSPDFLFIQLLRFEDYRSPKIDSKVMPENILVLPNNDKFKLVTIGNHLGSFIHNGHYQALVKNGMNWIKVDDTKAIKTNLMTEIAEENYIFVYRKYSTTTPFVASTHWEEVFEDQPVPPGLHVQLDTRTGRKYAKLLEEAHDKQNGKADNEDKNKVKTENQKSGEKIEGRMKHSENIDGNTKKKPKQALFEKEHDSKSKVSSSAIDKSNKCKGCKREYKNLSTHVKRLYTCQNYYKNDELMSLCQFATIPQEDFWNDGSKEDKKEELDTIQKETFQERTVQQDKEFLSCLEANNWLNDEIINQYMKLIGALDMKVLIYTSFFHTAFREGGFKRVQNYYRKYELLDYRELYIPVHKDNHWFLIIFNGTELVAIDH